MHLECQLMDSRRVRTLSCAVVWEGVDGLVKTSLHHRSKDDAFVPHNSMSTLISTNKGQVDGFVRELTFAK